MNRLLSTCRRPGKIQDTLDQTPAQEKVECEVWFLHILRRIINLTVENPDHVGYVFFSSKLAERYFVCFVYVPDPVVKDRTTNMSGFLLNIIPGINNFSLFTIILYTVLPYFWHYLYVAIFTS
jgi:hypothetical protein